MPTASHPRIMVFTKIVHRVDGLFLHLREVIKEIGYLSGCIRFRLTRGVRRVCEVDKFPECLFSL